MGGAAGALVVDPDRTLIWLGAGASVNAPTHLPLGEPLTWDALERFCLTSTVERIQAVHTVFGLTRGKDPLPPRLEVVLETAIGSAPDEVFDLLQPLIDAAPNLVHHLAAYVASQGGEVVTTNFDECVERAGGPSSNPRSVLHVHGVLRKRADLPTLGAFFNTIERGLPEQTARELDAALSRSSRVVFIGYSASDYFDVRPYLAALAVRGVDLTGCEVVWLAHDGHRPPDIESYQRWFEAAGATFRIEDANTVAEVEATWDGLGLSRPAVQLASPKTGDVRPMVNEHTRAWISFRLLEAIGDVQGRADLIDSGLVNPSHNERAAIAWSQGRYTDSLRWNQRAPVTTLADRTYRQERTGACLWAQGRLIPALVVLWRSRPLAVECIESGTDADIAAAAGWIDTTVRTLEHMDRVELKLLPKTAIRQRIRAMIPDDLTSLSFHARVHLEEVRTFLDAGAGSETARGVTGDVRDAMQQAASLAGFVNYRHRELRDLAAAGQTASPEEYRRLWELAEKLGASGDAVRIMFIPGAAAEFTLPDVIRSLFPRWFGSTGVQFAPWQRVRALGRFSLWRLRERVKAWVAVLSSRITGSTGIAG